MLSGVLPGLVLVAVATGVGRVIGSLVPAASALIVGILLGVAWRSFAGARPRFAPGLRFAQTWLLRGGVMLLGLQLAVAHVLHFGLAVHAVEAELASGTLVPVAVADLRLDRRLRAVWPKGRRLTGPAAALLQVI
jgi:uncharacterized membrane protein YadS